MKILAHLLATFLAFFCVGVLLGVCGHAESPSALLKARIAQLEQQLQQVRSELAVCAARVAIASQPQIADSLAKQRAEIEKEAGCAIDWAKEPPDCKP